MLWSKKIEIGSASNKQAVKSLEYKSKSFASSQDQGKFKANVISKTLKYLTFRTILDKYKIRTTQVKHVNKQKSKSHTLCKILSDRMNEKLFL